MRVLAPLLLASSAVAVGQSAPPPAAALSPERRAALVAAAERAGADMAVTPLRVRAADPAFRGKLFLQGSVLSASPLAAQALDALGAVRATFGKSTRVLPLSIIGRVGAGGAVPTDPKRLAWCDGRQERGNAIRCYQDLDADGRLDSARWGETYSDDSPYTLYMVGKAEPVAPAAYQKVDVAELPALELIYQGCRVTDRIQYSARIGVKGDGDVKTLGCPSAAEPIGKPEPVGPGRYRVDRVVVDVEYPTPELARTRIVEAIPAGTLLDRIDVGKPVKRLGERTGWPIEQAELRARYAAPPYRFDGTPALTAQGAEGTPLVAGPYRYGYTARIVEDARQDTMLSGRTTAFANGDALYGIPMQNPLARQQFDEPMMMWCAPKQRKPGDWRANCLQQQQVTRGVYTDMRNALWIEQIPAAANNTDAIMLEEGPAALPEASVRYAFAKWTPNRLLLRRIVTHGGADLPPVPVELPRSKDGSALFAIGGGVVAVTATPDALGFQARLVRPFDPDATALPTVGFLAQMLDKATREGRPLTLEERAALLDRD